MDGQILCARCKRDVTTEAAIALSDMQFGGYNPMSIQYAQPWPEEQVAEFLQRYVCQQCRG